MDTKTKRIFNSSVTEKRENNVSKPHTKNVDLGTKWKHTFKGSISEKAQKERFKNIKMKRFFLTKIKRFETCI